MKYANQYKSLTCCVCVCVGRLWDMVCCINATSCLFRVELTVWCRRRSRLSGLSWNVSPSRTTGQCLDPVPVCQTTLSRRYSNKQTFRDIAKLHQTSGHWTVLAPCALSEHQHLFCLIRLPSRSLLVYLTFFLFHLHLLRKYDLHLYHCKQFTNLTPGEV